MNVQLFRGAHAPRVPFSWLTMSFECSLGIPRGRGMQHARRVRSPDSREGFEVFNARTLQRFNVVTRRSEAKP